MEFTMTFIDLFLTVLYLCLPVLLALASFVIILGLIVGHKEHWSSFDSTYWALITGFTVGYGDIRPLTRLSKVLAILIAWTGIMFTGVIVAATVTATSSAVKDNLQPDVLQKVEKKLR